MKNNTIYYKGKFRTVFNVSFSDYQCFTMQKKACEGKSLNLGQIQFLRFPFITSVISAKKRREKVKLENVRFYYHVKQPQLKLNL
jgi:hypothetical protein